MALTWLVALALAQLARAQDYRFPAGDAHYSAFYPTAYKDQGGSTDWGCGSITYSGHNGSDFGFGSWGGMDAGRAIVAAAEGTVVGVNDGEYDRCSTGDCGGGGGFGNYVKIAHANGRSTYYAHLKQWTVAVAVGQAVGCGTHLGYGGSSGNSTGPHVHFEVRESSGYASDPFDGSCSAPPTYWLDQGDYGGLPGGTCENAGPCNVVASLACGQTLTSANNASGATQSHALYGCGEWPTSGPEIAYSFSTPLDEPVTLGLTGMSGDIDLFVLGSTVCDGSGAVTCSTNSDATEEWISFNASANVVYTIVVDGYDGIASGFNLSASCVGKVDEPEPVDTGTSPVDEPRPNDTSASPVPGRKTELASLGCGAEGEEEAPPYDGGEPGTKVPLPEAAGGLLLGIGAWAWRRRARRTGSTRA